MTPREIRMTKNAIRGLREEHNLTQEEFAWITRVSRQAVSKWESMQTWCLPCIDHFVFLAWYFNVSIDDLIVLETKRIA